MPISKKIATTAKEDVQDPMLLTVKSYTEHLEAGHPVSFHACANKFGVSRETLRQRIAGRRTCKEANDDMAWFTPEEDPPFLIRAVPKLSVSWVVDHCNT